ncbi:YbaK/EbsC family protein [Streptomyces iconiensis]|uniref:YbaK/EbsC family protein n=1 Tax=Streptomyces iconiensis TaxID=1384038 RepID=A0ABT7A4R6_9ACTN|nr:YbaK/EbsC family protein [Streptomyces iconiensis]MDJ1135613.1 YbaK/EbsC family protein [Streptomyces iconiensis]
MRAPIGTFDHAVPATEALQLLCEPVAKAVREWRGPVPADQLLFVDTDPDKADTAVFIETYGADLTDASANLVVVAAKRAVAGGTGSERGLAACLVPATTRADVNGAVRRQLGARKVSFAPHATAVEETGMEFGGITPFGLPAGWPLLVDSAVVDLPWVLVGSGSRRGKLIVPGKALEALPDAYVMEGLGLRA